jgi:hypothetical protein
MKLSGLLPLFIAGSSWLAADEVSPVIVSTVNGSTPAATQSTAANVTDPKPAAPKPADAKPAQISPGLAQELTSILPKYAPPPQTTKPAPLDADVLELPKMTIHKPRPRLKLTTDVVMTTQAFNEKLAKENLSSFDRNVLNKFTLPLFGVSAEQRARDEYERQKRDELARQVSDLAKVTEVVDPAQAKALRDAVSKP